MSLVGAPRTSSQLPPESLSKRVQLINTAIHAGQHMLAAREAYRLAWRMMAEYSVNHEYVLCLRQVGAYAHFLGGYYGRAAHECLEIARAWAVKGDYAQATDDLVRSAAAWLLMPASEDTRQLGHILLKAWDRTPSRTRTTGLMHRRHRAQIERRMSALALLRTEPPSRSAYSVPFLLHGRPGARAVEPTPKPEPCSRAVSPCQEVVRCTEPDQTHSWKTMTMYQETNATDTLDMASLLIAAYCQHTHLSEDTLQSSPRTSRRQSPAAGPQDANRAPSAGQLGGAAPNADGSGPRMPSAWVRRQTEDTLATEDDPQKLFTEACLHGLRAKFCDDVDSLADFLPPQVAAMARKVADALEVPQPATV